MNNYKYFAWSLIAFLLLIVSNGYGQVVREYQFKYDDSGNRTKRMHVITMQEISLKTGWNIFSTYVLPEDRDMLSVTQTLIDDGYLIKVSDEIGTTLENYGIFGGWVNNIGDILATEGYKIDVTADCTLRVPGNIILLPLNINLSTGWNIISYPRQVEEDAAEVVQPLLDNGTLIKVQDELGNSYEDWGFFGGWTNNIGNFKPGEGYKVKVSSNTQLTIFDSYNKSALVTISSNKSGHFSPVFKGKGVDHMNINIVEIPSWIAEEGDEISVSDGKLCVGALKISEQQIKNNRAQLVASSVDFKGGNGFLNENKFDLKLWKRTTEKEYKLLFEPVYGDSKFEKHGSRFIRLTGIITDEVENMLVAEEDTQSIKDTQSIDSLSSIFYNKSTDELNLLDSPETYLNCYPNPLTDDVTIEFFIPENSFIVLSVYNSAGQLVQLLAEGNEPKGIIRYNWKRINQSGQRVPSGIYICKLKVNNQSYNKKLIVR